MIDFIVAAIVLAILGGILLYLYRAKKAGRDLHRLPLCQAVRRRSLRRTQPPSKKTLRLYRNGDARLWAAYPSTQGGV